jgi:hypothetical protein
MHFTTEGTTAAATLTPSEVVVLHGERFAGEGGLLRANEVLLLSGAKVRADQLAEAALAALILANEQAGHLRLALEKKKVFFGLFKREALMAYPATPAAWPARSAEWAISQSVQERPKEVDELLSQFIGERTSNGAGQALAQVKAGMAARGVLEVEEKKVLKVFTTSTFVASDTTRAMAAAARPDAVKELLGACERQRPEVWKALMADVRGAIDRMTETDTDRPRLSGGRRLRRIKTFHSILRKTAWRRNPTRRSSPPSACWRSSPSGIVGFVLWDEARTSKRLSAEAEAVGFVATPDRWYDDSKERDVSGHTLTYAYTDGTTSCTPGRWSGSPGTTRRRRTRCATIRKIPSARSCTPRRTSAGADRRRADGRGNRDPRGSAGTTGRCAGEKG